MTQPNPASVAGTSVSSVTRPGLTPEALEERIGNAIDAALQRFAKELHAGKEKKAQVVFGEDGQNPFEPNDPQNANKSFTNWMRLVRHNDHHGLEKHFGERYATKVALSGDSGSSGGYLVPEQFLDRIMEVASENSFLKNKATRIPMTSRSVTVPALDVTTAPTAGETAMFGGLVATWEEEAGAINETEPTFKNVELVAHELSGYSKVSNAVLADSAVSLDSLLMMLFGKATAWFQEYAFLRGNGVGKPLGVLRWDGLISVTRSGASAFALADAAGMLARLLPGWQANQTVWAIHPTVIAKLLQMSDTAGNVIFINNARERPVMTLMGLEVHVTEKLPTLGTQGDVLLMDLQHYLVGERDGIQIDFSPHVAFLNNQSAWRFISRIDGQPWLSDKVTLSDAGSTLSPFVALSTAT